jgi:hypothetical protein
LYLLKEIKALLGPEKDSALSTRQHPFSLADIKNGSSDLGSEVAASHVAFKVAMCGRKIFTTAHSHLGLGMRSMQKDNEVWVLRGVNVPVILRRREEGETYELVGESYVHGCMYGELVSEDVEPRFGSVKIT